MQYLFVSSFRLTRPVTAGFASSRESCKTDHHEG